MRLRLRTQALIGSLLLLSVPVAGYHLVISYETHLLAGQRNALLASTEQLANTLSHAAKPALARIARRGETSDIYAYPLAEAIVVDGRDDDWGSLAATPVHYDTGDALAVNEPWPDASLHFSLAAAANEGDLYLLVSVVDDAVVYRQPGSLSVHRNDHLQLALVKPDGTYQRYTFAPTQPGAAAAFAVTTINEGSRAIREESDIEAYWLAVENGYQVEIRLPVTIISDALSLTVTDVDDPESRRSIGTLGTASTAHRSDIGTLVRRDPQLLAHLAHLGFGNARIRILDRDHRMLAQHGDIASAAGMWRDAEQPLVSLGALLTPVNANVRDQAVDAANITSPHIDNALHGQASVTSRRSSDNTATILSAAAPLISDNGTIGVLLAEETTNGILQLRNRLITDIILISVLVLLSGALLLAAFGSLIGRRIQGIGQRLEATIDAQGRVTGDMPAPAATDEIGELERQFGEVASRLHQYNRYLEDLSKRLGHELRTPLTVIRSSLDNLDMAEIDDDARVYLTRANEGVHRLASILSSMTEATRLEESLDTSEAEYFDLADVVRGSVEGYRTAYPGQAFELSIEGEFNKLFGLPDLVVQMLDKLISNAVEFAEEATPVRVRLNREETDAVLRVINTGPNLPSDMASRLFDSMISVRGGTQDSGTHLGLGLYIARIIARYHGGAITAHNREDTRGVIVSVRLPLNRVVAER